jgi:hypothetical protein
MTSVARTTFDGLAAVELKTPAARLVAVTAWGPRIAFFGAPGDQNLLLWAPGRYTRGAWDLRGGHRVWATRPGADECEDTYALDNAPCTVELAPDGFCVMGAENPANRTRRGVRVRSLDDQHIAVDNILENTGDMLYSGGVWALTCTVPTPDTTYGVPLGDGSEWDSCSIILFRRWAGHGAGGFDDPQFRVQGDMLAITPRGVENKRMLQSHRGIIAMRDPQRGVTFAKRTPWQPGVSYPGGANMAAYIGPDNFMVEMETMGPERTLRPGEQLVHTETWVLRAGSPAIDSGKQVDALFA